MDIDKIVEQMEHMSEVADIADVRSALKKWITELRDFQTYLDEISR